MLYAFVFFGVRPNCWWLCTSSCAMSRWSSESQQSFFEQKRLEKLEAAAQAAAAQAAAEKLEVVTQAVASAQADLTAAAVVQVTGSPVQVPQQPSDGVAVPLLAQVVFDHVTLQRVRFIICMRF